MYSCQPEYLFESEAFAVFCFLHLSERISVISRTYSYLKQSVSGLSE